MTEHHFETPDPVELSVENGRGSVHVHAVETTASHVEITGSGAEEVLVELRGSRLSIQVPQQRGFLSGGRSLTMTVTVPTGSALEARLGSADLVTTGTVGTTQVRSGSGDVRIDVLAESGLVETGSGEVRLAEAHADLRVKSGSGGVSLGDVAGALAVSTGSGDVEIGDSHAEARVKTGSGDLTVRRAHADVSLTTGSGDLTVDSISRGRLSVKGASGDVRVGVPAGVPVWTDVSTVSGRIHSTLQGAGQPEPGADHVELRATTVSGDISLSEK